MEFWSEGGVWKEFSSLKALKQLYNGFGTPETSIYFHPYLQMYYMLELSFYGDTIQILLANEVQGS
jgi:hypothetical protein